jgi:ParB/RepB/Spo0J family partition protein
MGNECRALAKRIDFIPLNKIVLKENYRKTFDRRSLEELLESIRSCGQIDPIIVERRGRAGASSERFELVAGERRYLAAKIGGLAGLKGVVYGRLTKRQRLMIQLEENTQEPVPQHELVESYWQRYLLFLGKHSGRSFAELRKYPDYWKIPQELRSAYTAADFARAIGKDEPIINSALRYQCLGEHVRQMVESGRLSCSAALELARLPSKNTQYQLAKDAFEQEKSAKTIGMEISKLLEEKVEFFAAGGESADSEEVFARAKASEFYKVLADASKLFRSYLLIGEKIPGIVSKRMFRRSEALGPLFLKVGEAMESFEQMFWQENPGNLDKILQPKKQKRRSLKERILASEAEKENGAAGEQHEYITTTRINKLPLGCLVPDSNNPRKTYDALALKHLAKSMEELGQITPIIVRPIKEKGGKGSGKSNEKYMIVAGHRRFNAAKLKPGAIKTLDAVVAELTDEEALEIQLEENTKVAPKGGERAEGIYSLYAMKTEGRAGAARKDYSVGDFAKEYSWLINTAGVRRAIDYCGLDTKVKELERNGLLSYGVAVELAGVKKEERLRWAIAATANRWSAAEFKKRFNSDTQHSLNGNLFGGDEKEDLNDYAVRLFTEQFSMCLKGLGYRFADILDEKKYVMYSERAKQRLFAELFKDRGRIRKFGDFKRDFNELSNLFKAPEQTVSYGLS